MRRWKAQKRNDVTRWRSSSVTSRRCRGLSSGLVERLRLHIEREGAGDTRGEATCDDHDPRPCRDRDVVDAHPPIGAGVVRYVTAEIGDVPHPSAAITHALRSTSEEGTVARL